MFDPSKPNALRLPNGSSQPLDRQRILGAHIDVALGRADRVGRDQHAFEHAMRIAFEHAAIHERAGIAFVGVADDVFLRADRLSRPCSTSGRWDIPRRRARASRSS